MSVSIKEIKSNQKVAEIKSKNIEQTIKTEVSPLDEKIDFTNDETYQTKVIKCIDLLGDPKWKWRTEDTLKKNSKMKKDEFNYFITHDTRIRESELLDINDNRIFGLRSRVD